MWLDEYGEKDVKFSIIDDDNGMGILSKFLVLIDTDIGITELDAEKVVLMLQ